MIVVLHGNNSCRSGCIPKDEMLKRAGYAAVLVSLDFYAATKRPELAEKQRKEAAALKAAAKPVVK